MTLTPAQMLFVAKNEQAHAMKTALLQARIRIMAEEIFPANRYASLGA